LNEENMVPKLYLDDDSREKPVDEKLAVWNIHFFQIQKRNDQNSLEMMVREEQ
jgi:hypothetical protein